MNVLPQNHGTQPPPIYVPINAPTRDPVSVETSKTLTTQNNTSLVGMDKLSDASLAPRN